MFYLPDDLIKTILLLSGRNEIVIMSDYYPKLLSEEIIEISLPYLQFIRKENYKFLKNSRTQKDSIIRYMPNLISLNLAHNHKQVSTVYETPTYLCTTDNGIKELSNLTCLNLDGNTIITDNGIKNLTSLTSLDLSYNENITDEGIRKLKNLTNLNLWCNEKITDDGLKHLVNLKILNLCNNKKITNDGLKYLVDLTNINVSHNRNISIKGINCLINLTSIDRYMNNNLIDYKIKLSEKK
jgi:hypothetical protein